MKIKNKVLSAVFIISAASVFSANAEKPGNFGKCDVKVPDKKLPLTPKENDTLTVATVLPNPGWFNGLSPEKVDGGFEYCLAANIASRAGLHHIKIRNLAWDQFISGTVKDYDIAMSNATITDARKKVFDFTQSYFDSNLGVAVKKNADVNENNIRSKRVGVLQGNLGAEWVSKTLKPSAISIFQSQSDMFTGLMAGQVDAVITDTTLVLTQAKASGNQIKAAGQFELKQGYGVITPLHSANSKNVDSIVGDLKSDGTLNALGDKWLKPLFGVAPSDVPVWSVK
ncbi:TPA: amino acid ABC transporter substrate-binding protein [Klebsiella pneumoniae]|nr:amino acid ABC transporter substrate-binding protein [Klebsiella pneumoniae]